MNTLPMDATPGIEGAQSTHMNDAVGPQDITSCDGCVHAARARGQFGARRDKLEGVCAVGGN